MKRNNLHNVFFAVIILLLIILGILISLIFNISNKLDEHEIIRYNSFKLADELKQSSDDLTRFCRTYVLTGDSIWRNKYWEVLDIRNGIKTRANGRKIALQDSILKLGIVGEELEKLKEAEKNSNDLVWTERTAFNAMVGLFADSTNEFTIKAAPDTALAQRIMFDQKYHENKESIMAPIAEFFNMLDQRTTNTVEKLRTKEFNLLKLIIVTILLIAGISFYAILIFRKKIISQLNELNTLNTKLELKVKQRTSELENNVVELNNLNRELEIAEERYRFLTNSTFEGIVVHKNGVLVDCNESFLNIIGYSVNEIEDINLVELLVFELDKNSQYEKLKTEESGTYSIPLRKKDGNAIWVEIETKYVHYKNEKVRIAAVRDITEKRQAQEDILKFKTIADKSLFGNAIATPEGILIYINEYFANIHGYTADELIGKHLSVFHTEKQLPAVEGSLKETFTKGRINAIEINHTHRDGTEFPMLMGITLITEESGAPKYLGATAIDLSEIKKAELKTHQMAENFENIFNETHDAVTIFDFEGYFIEVNKTYTKQMGFSHEELIGKHIQVINPVLTKENISQLINNLRETKGLLNFETTHQTKEGKRFPVEVHSKIIMYNGNEVILSIARDITERINAENELERNANFLSALLNNMPTPLFFKDVNGKYLGCNKAFEDLFGKSSEEITGKTVFEVWPAKNSTVFYDKDLELLEHPGYQQYESSITDKKGEEKNVLFAKNVYYDEQGKISGIIGSFIDITQRVHSEKLQIIQLKLIEKSIHHNVSEILKSFLDEAEIMTKSKIGFYHFIDDNQENILLQEWSTHTTNGYCVVDLEDRHYPVSQAGVWADCVKTGKAVVHNDYQSLKNKKGLPNGHAPVIRELVVPVLRDGKTKAILGVGNKQTDYTEIEVNILQQMADLAWEIIERKIAEEELKKYQENLEGLVQQRTEELEASNREMEAFSYSVSHDLRAPLRAINGFASYLREDYENKLDSEGKRYLDVIQENSVKMDQLISDLLKLSRTSRSELDFVEINMEALARSMYMEVATEKEQSEYEFIIEKIPNIKGDLTSIKQLWSNLIGNAIKYSYKSPVKKIEIGCSGTDNELVTYFIKDSGCGFNPEYKDKLFEIFQRLHKDEDYKGSGVGLAIVKRIIDKHEGKIWAEGEINKGATFYFSLPKTLT